MVDEGDPGVDADPLGEVPAGDRPRRLQGSLGGVDHRPDPQRLGDDRVEVGVVAVPRARRACAPAPRGCGAAGRPRSEPGRRRLVARGEHRHQLVAKLDVGHRLAVLVAGAQQQREHVGSLVEVRLPPPPLDLLVEERVGRAQPPREPAAGAERARSRARSASGTKKRIWVSITASIAVAQPLDPVRLVDAEDRSADDLEGQVAHPLAQLELASPGPSGRPRPRRPRGSSAASRSAARPGTAAAAACAGAGARGRRGRARSGRRAPPTSGAFASPACRSD